MIGTFDCVYETPCGWCSKWDKKCDRKIPFQGQRAKCKPVDDYIGDNAKAITNILCKSDFDHEWECCGISTVETTYICKKCNAYKTIPNEIDDSMSVTLK